MKEKFKIEDIDVVIADDKIVHDENQAIIYRVLEDEDYTFDAVTCLARPVEFSVASNLYPIDKQDIAAACEVANTTRKINVISTGEYHLVLCPLIERNTFFGKDQAFKLTSGVIDEAIKLNITSLRITQFCLMLGQLPYYDQFKGILNAFVSRKDSPIKLVYFDVPDKNFYELKKLFSTYENQHNKANV